MIKTIRSLRREIAALEKSGHVQTEFGGYGGDDDPLISAKQSLHAWYAVASITIIGAIGVVYGLMNLSC